MALPKAVQEQIDTANKIAKEIYNPDPDPNEGGDENNENNKLAPPDTETPPTNGVDKTPPPAKEPPKAEETTDEHRYKVLQGKYNAEVPRLQAQLREEQDRNAELSQRLLNLESTVATLNTVREPAIPSEQKPVGATPEEIDQFGPDLVDLIERVADSRVQGKVAESLKPMQARLKQVDDTTSQVRANMANSGRQKLLSDLGREVPDWERQNEDPEFLNWLNEKDLFSGQARAQLLAQAFSSLDTERVIAFFKGFQSENVVVTPEPAPPLNTEAEPQATLDEFVAPGTPKTGSTSAPNESGKRVWTRKDVSKFYADKNEYVKVGKKPPKEMEALERDIFAAQREGRIR